MPTLWDRLKAAGVPATYYYCDIPYLSLWGERYMARRSASTGSSSMLRPARCRSSPTSTLPFDTTSPLGS